MTVKPKAVEKAVRALLVAIGEDPSREGLHGTPSRLAQFFQDFLSPDYQIALFDAEQYDNLVIIRGISVWSLCEHHLLPFHSNVAVAYLPHGLIAGLSKLVRAVYRSARRLTTQERMTDTIAREISQLTDSPDVAVLSVSLHLCMAMRGVTQPHAHTITSALRGQFRENPALRQEFLTLATTPSTHALW